MEDAVDAGAEAIQKQEWVEGMVRGIEGND